jgi:hypothetical protein
MILGAEIGLFVYGIIALIRGQFSIGKAKTVYGADARILGAISLLPLPIAGAAGFSIGMLYPQSAPESQMNLVIAGIELAIFAGIVFVVLMLGNRFYMRKAKSVSVAGV